MTTLTPTDNGLTGSGWSGETLLSGGHLEDCHVLLPTHVRPALVLSSPGPQIDNEVEATMP